MIDVSAAWRAAMNDSTRYTTSAVITLAGGTELEITPADVCVGGNRFSDGPGQDAFPVGAAISRTAQLRLDNADGRYADTDFAGAVIELSLDFGGESAAIGRFTVLEPETYGETVVITARDDMYKADRAFSTELSYPTTAGALWSEICQKCGITDGMAGGIPQGAAPVASAPAPDLTCRAVLGYIAMLSGGNARVSRSGALEIVNYDFAALDAQRAAGTAEGIHDLTMWRSLRLDTEDVTVTGVRAASYDGAVLAGEEGYVLELDNPLFAGREQAALAVIAQALVGASFRGFSGEYVAYPLAEFGDGARITDRRGSTYYTVVTDVGFAWFAPTTLACAAESPMRAASRYAAATDATVITNLLIAAGGIDAGRIAVRNLDASNITAGAMTVRDAGNNIVFQADKDARSAQIGGFTAGLNDVGPYSGLYSLAGDGAVLTVGEDDGTGRTVTLVGPWGVDTYGETGQGTNVFNVIGELRFRGINGAGLYLHGAGGGSVNVSGDMTFTSSGGNGRFSFSGADILLNGSSVGGLFAKLNGSVITDSNTVSGLTAALYYHPAIPNVMCLKIRGTAAAALSTAAGYATLWNANAFLTNAVGARSAAVIKYVVSTVYAVQLNVDTAGNIRIGYTRRLSDGAACDIPAGSNIYIEETVFLK